MFASFLSEGMCPLSMQQKEDEVFVGAGCCISCRISNRAPWVTQVSILPDHLSGPAEYSGSPSSSVCRFSLSWIRSLELAEKKLVCGLQTHTIPKLHWGGGRGGEDCGTTLLVLEFQNTNIKNGKEHVSAQVGVGRGFFFFFLAHLSWQPYSASVKTRYRNVLWVTFKTRYKSSALWDCSAINYLA